MEEDFTDLQRLLRLKRHETPPPDFMEDFLFEFHQRQRAELLKRPLWRLALDRLEGALPNFQLPQYAYASACGAALVVAGVFANHILTASPVSHGGSAMVGATALAANDSGDRPANGFHAPSPQSLVRSPRFDINARRPSVSLADLDFDKPTRQAAGSAAVMRSPRYVLDTRPVSYEQPESF